jgi:hypothetical protein
MAALVLGKRGVWSFTWGDKSGHACAGLMVTFMWWNGPCYDDRPGCVVHQCGGWGCMTCV